VYQHVVDGLMGKAVFTDSMVAEVIALLSSHQSPLLMQLHYLKQNVS